MRWRWRKVRLASIPVVERDLFERYGEAVIASVIAGGFTPAAIDLHPLYRDSIIQEHARDWLTECRDTHIRKEQRVEVLVAENSDLKQKLADAEKTVREISADKPKKEQELADVRKQIADLQSQLAATVRDNGRIPR